MSSWIYFVILNFSFFHDLSLMEVLEFIKHILARNHFSSLFSIILSSIHDRFSEK